MDPQAPAGDDEAIYRLTYVSWVASPHLPSDLEDILLASVANNARDGITGFLLCDGVAFAQALEGDRDAVEACLARIAADPRNTRLDVRERRSVDARAFGGWSMCGLYLSDREDALLRAGDIAINLSDLSPGALWQHLTGISQRHAADLDAEHARLIADTGALALLWGEEEPAGSGTPAANPPTASARRRNNRGAGER